MSETAHRESHFEIAERAPKSVGTGQTGDSDEGKRPVDARRVVTGHDGDGKAVFVSDDMVAPVTLALLPGSEFHQLWSADTAPTFPDDGARPSAPRYFPPLGGVRFGFFTIPPDGGAGAPADLDV